MPLGREIIEKLPALLLPRVIELSRKVEFRILRILLKHADPNAMPMLEELVENLVKDPGFKPGQAASCLEAAGVAQTVELVQLIGWSGVNDLVDTLTAAGIVAMMNKCSSQFQFAELYHKHGALGMYKLLSRVDHADSLEE